MAKGKGQANNQLLSPSQPLPNRSDPGKNGRVPYRPAPAGHSPSDLLEPPAPPDRDLPLGLQALPPDSDLTALQRTHCRPTTLHPPRSPPTSPPPPPPPSPRFLPSLPPRVRPGPGSMAQIHPRFPPLPVPTPRRLRARARLPLGRLAPLVRVEQIPRGLQPLDAAIQSPPPARIRLVAPRLGPRRLGQPSHGAFGARGPVLLRLKRVAQVLIQPALEAAKPNPGVGLCVRAV